MAFFNTEFVSFMGELRANNQREWFNANKKRYIEHVKEPFEHFVAHMIEFLKPEMPGLLMTPKDAIYRIYRDTRFSKDKTPYKEHVSAAFSPGGKKDMTSSGVFLQLRDDQIRIYSGVYMPDKTQLNAIRHYIAEDPRPFQKLYARKAFKDKFGEIRGEKNKRLPKDLQEAALVEPLIFNKGFYYYADLDSKWLLSKDLPKEILKYYKIVRPINEYFQEAMENG